MTEPTTPPVKPLGLLTEAVEAMGLEITYAYDDLAFGAHNIFLVQFPPDAGAPLQLFFNETCETEAADAVENALTEECAKRGLALQRAGLYVLEDGGEDDEELHLELRPGAVLQ